MSVTFSTRREFVKSAAAASIPVVWADDGEVTKPTGTQLRVTSAVLRDESLRFQADINHRCTRNYTFNMQRVDLDVAEI